MDVDKHGAGAFSWPELATSDQQAGVAFYRSLFGWDIKEAPLGGGETYSMFTMRGREVAAAYTMRADERQMGIPPHWNAYVTVDDVDATAERAPVLGGKVIAPPFDVMDAGRMAVIQDPTGAYFQIWQPKRSIGARVLNEDGALCWTELSTRDPKTAGAFYTQLLGWSAKVGGEGVNAYTEFTPAGGQYPVAGMIDIAAFGDRGKHVPPNWMPYFQVPDVDARATKAASLGANVGVPPTDIQNVGRFACIADPQGAVFAVFTPKRV
jgi:predicted enzyme related to lactoylglutathione lyase